MISSRQRLMQPALYRYCRASVANAYRLHAGARCHVLNCSSPWSGKRSMGTKSPGSDPLDVLRKECSARNRCDEEGFRLNTTLHWTFSFSIGSPDPKMAPNLRTLGIQRVSPDGIDFVMKRSSPTAVSARAGLPAAFVYQEGKFLPGQSAEQWRGEGVCEEIPLAQVVDLIPSFTATSMIASCRIAAEVSSANAADVSDGRLAMMNKSRTTEVMQRTRNELEKGAISMDEMNEAIAAFRLKPDRMEYMRGGPDTVMWDRWEWLRDKDGWIDPKHLVPH